MFDVAQPCGVIVRSCCLVEACRGVFGGARRPLSSRLHERLAAAREHKETCPLGRGGKMLVFPQFHTYFSPNIL